YLESDTVKGVNNVMIITRNVPRGARPREGFELVRNADYPTFLDAVARTKMANDPKVMAIRVMRPGDFPTFAADARGFLVASVPDFQIALPVPTQAGRGGLAGPPAKVYRIKSPRAEIALSLKVTPETPTSPVRLAGRIEEFDPGTTARVYAINDDES